MVYGGSGIQDNNGKQIAHTLKVKITYIIIIFIPFISLSNIAADSYLVH